MTGSGALAHSFSRSASNYHTNAGVQRRIAEKLIEMIDPSFSPDAIADFGAGTGFLTEALARRYAGASIDAVDISSGMIDRCRATTASYPSVRCYVEDARDFRGAAKYDLIASSSALQWMHPISKSLMHFHELLAPGGQFVAAVMLDGTLRELRSLRAELVPSKPGVPLLPSASELSEWVTGAGLSLRDFTVEVVQQSFADAAAMLSNISTLGLSGPVDVGGGKILTRGELSALTTEYDRRYRVQDESGIAVRATYEVGFLVAAGR